MIPATNGIANAPFGKSEPIVGHRVKITNSMIKRGLERFVRHFARHGIE